MSAAPKINYHKDNECYPKLHKQNSKIRKYKVCDIRSKLNSGSYNIDERLDIVIDKLLEDILM